MRILIALLSVCMLASVPAFAQDTKAATTPASDASIRKLLEVMHARKMVDAMPRQVSMMMNGMMKKMMQGQPSDQQKQAMETLASKLGALMKDEFNWQTMEPAYIKIYRQTFTQSEVDAMVGFYSSPAGQAVVDKLPLVTQSAMSAMQDRMVALMPKIQQMAQDAAKEAGTAAAPAAAAKSGQ